MSHSARFFVPPASPHRMYSPTHLGSTSAACVLLLAAVSACHTAPDPYETWRTYGGDPSGSQYSSLDQIDRTNVRDLQVAWTYRTGDARADRSQIQCNPIVVDGVLFGTTPGLKVFALDAATGDERWVFDPFDTGDAEPSGVNRGVVYWEDDETSRILYSAGPTLYALDAATGKLVQGFGDGGRVDLKQGLGRNVEDLFVNATTPGVIYDDLLIMGTRVSEKLPSAPGHIRAFDVRTGDLRWIFHTIPHPGEYGYDTWPPDAWTHIGGANVWTGMSVDHERGLVFAPTGSAAFDFWGGNRAGRNLFANSLLALDAETGERVWHFQGVRHDLWDRDFPAAPNLLTVRRNGRSIDAVAQVTKSGHVFVFNRETGESLFPLEERRYPPSDLKGEETWPTQVLPALPAPFARQQFTEDMVTRISPEAHETVLQRFRETRSGGQFIPPSTEGTMIFPGFDGGAEWGGAAHDPERGILYVNANEMPWILTMVETEPDEESDLVSLGQQTYTTNCAACHGIDRQGDEGQQYPSLLEVDERFGREEVDQILTNGRGFMPSFQYLSEEERAAVVGYLFGDEAPGGMVSVSRDAVPYTHTGYNRFFDPDGYPAVEPPWGTLTAIDLNDGAFLWQVPLGEFDELTQRGLPPTGTENYGGPAVTAGGLLFIGASKDERFRAFDVETGDVLWETQLPAGGYATPSVYEAGGKQYVVIACGGGKMGTPSGDTYVAFALPDE